MVTMGLGLKPQPLLVTPVPVKSEKPQTLWCSFVFGLNHQEAVLPKGTSMCSPLSISSFPRLRSRQNKSPCLYTEETPKRPRGDPRLLCGLRISYKPHLANSASITEVEKYIFHTSQVEISHSKELFCLKYQYYDRQS